MNYLQHMKHGEVLTDTLWQAEKGYPIIGIKLKNPIKILKDYVAKKNNVESDKDQSNNNLDQHLVSSSDNNAPQFNYSSYFTSSGNNSFNISDLFTFNRKPKP